MHCVVVVPVGVTVAPLTLDQRDLVRILDGERRRAVLLRSAFVLPKVEYVVGAGIAVPASHPGVCSVSALKRCGFLHPQPEHVAF